MLLAASMVVNPSRAAHVAPREVLSVCIVKQESVRTTCGSVGIVVLAALDS